jgi:hypothetical protein
MQPITEYIPGFTDLVVKNSAVLDQNLKAFFIFAQPFANVLIKTGFITGY